jgi:hypothetical protein
MTDETPKHASFSTDQPDEGRVVMNIRIGEIDMPVTQKMMDVAVAAFAKSVNPQGLARLLEDPIISDLVEKTTVILPPGTPAAESDD